MTTEFGVYTAEDLAREREQSPALRWELLDGELVVTPSPRYAHQHAVARLLARLLAAVGPDLDVVPAPFDAVLSDHDVLQPDLLVARREDIQEDGLHRAPILAVEVLSPSTRRRDLLTKLELLQRAGCPHYWVIDPDEVSLRAWRLVDGRYELATRTVGDAEVHVSDPVALSFRVSDLLPPR